MGAVEDTNAFNNPFNFYCNEKSRTRPFGLTLDLGAYPAGRRYPLGSEFEKFNPSWGSDRVDAEMARHWSNIPSLARTEFRYPASLHSFVYFRLGLHRDIAAWHQDPLGSNAPLSDQEVDLNEPSLGYFHAENEHFAYTVGRFPVHWSPSSDFGLALSSAVPYHNAMEFTLKMPRARYRFLVSSLNPWLEGTPSGDTSSEDYPPGSEEYRQRHYADQHGAVIFHKRVYAERVKTLFAHRLEGNLGRLGLGVTETQIIGGKFPDLRDAGPYVFFHNDFKDGYTNSALSLDASLRLPAGFSLAAELYLDDVQYAETEGEDNSASLQGYLGAVRHAMNTHGWLLFQSLHAVRTDPYLYGYLQPLNTMASRHVLASNYGGVRGASLTDRYVVDYPMGYLRGGDSFDFWYRMEAWRGALELSLSASVLARGGISLSTPYQNYYSTAHDSPTGTVEREIRVDLGSAYRLRHGLTAHAGLAFQGIRNSGNVYGNEARRAQASAGLAWTML
ncbi:MAG: hypothetical protein JWP91_1666 [Fibrobacteres bacterium]|nr:hypothetical protein [Fibrobacterota bacterium]